jgi:hypothetical protein
MIVEAAFVLAGMRTALRARANRTVRGGHQRPAPRSTG